MKKINFQKVTISFDETHHILNNTPIYEKKFKKVMSFHPPGVAAVRNSNSAYRIDIHGEPTYSYRFLKTFGYYQDLAAVIDQKGWCHIDLKGFPIYKNRYDWAGNFQENRCPVKTNGHYFHINQDGKRVYPQDYNYTGDYKYGIAVVYKKNNLATHIDLHGNEIHGKEFKELGIFHKGYAVAKDEEGYFHIDKVGNPLYDQRYLWCEPFYNEKSFGCDRYGKLGTISENGIFKELKF